MVLKICLSQKYFFATRPNENFLKKNESSFSKTTRITVLHQDTTNPLTSGHICNLHKNTDPQKTLIIYGH